MKIKKSVLALCLIAFSSCFITSCNGQSYPETKQKSNQKASPKYKEEDQIGQYIIDIYEDNNGNLWFGTLMNSIAKYDGKTLQFLSSDDGLPEDRIGTVIQDSVGNYWFSSHSGISKYDGKKFTHFSEKDGLIDNRVSNLFFDNKGLLWIGTWGGISTFDGQKFNNFRLPSPNIEIPVYQETSDWISVIKQDSKGNMWFGRSGLGVTMYNGKSFTFITKEDGLLSNAIQDIQEDKNGNLWFSSRVSEKDHPDPTKRNGPGGIVKYDGEKFVSFPKIEGLYNNDVYEIYSDSKDNIWIGTIKNGVYKYDGETFTNYTGNNPSNGFPKAVVRIFEDNKGTFWLACAGGLFRMEGESIINVTKNGPWK